MLEKVTYWSAWIKRDNFVIKFCLILDFIKILFKGLIFETQLSLQTFHIFLQICKFFFINFLSIISSNFLDWNLRKFFYFICFCYITFTLLYSYFLFYNKKTSWNICNLEISSFNLHIFTTTIINILITGYVA